MNYCSRCGQKLPEDDSSKCSNCGLEIMQTTTQKAKKSKPQGVIVISILSVIVGIIALFFGLFMSWVFSSLIGLTGQNQYISMFTPIITAIW